MKKFTCVQDIGNLKSAIEEAFEIKKDRFKYSSTPVCAPASAHRKPRLIWE